MRHPLALVLVASLATTFACKREDTSSPTEGAEPTDTTTEPAPTETATTEPAQPSAESLEVCAHMGGIMRADIGDLATFTDEEIAKSEHDCAVDLDAKRAENPGEFDTKRACVMAATTVDTIVACG